jgi:hypothetical protein
MYTVTIKRIYNKVPHDITFLERIYQICVCQGEYVKDRTGDQRGGGGVNGSR